MSAIAARAGVVLLAAGLSLGVTPGEAERAVLEPDGPPLIELPMSDAPGATTILTAEEIERSGAANIFELLRRVPGLDVRYTPMGGHLGIRGTGVSPFSEQVLLLVDGAPFNSPDKGGFPGHPNYAGYFPLHRIARIEIVRGPVSVLYGANAFAGVINIVTKTSLPKLADRVQGTALETAVAGGSFDLMEGHVTGAFLQGGAEGSISVSGFTGRTPILLNQEAEHRVDRLHANVRRGGFTGSVLHTDSKNGSFPFDTTTTLVASHKTDVLDLRYERQVGQTTLRGSATYNHYRGTTCGVCHNNETGPPDDALTTDIGGERETDQRVRLALRADRALTDRQDLSAGFEALSDRIERDVVVQPGADTTMGSGGVYLQHQWRLPARLKLLSGIRLDRAENLGSVGSPRIALVSEPTPWLLVRGSAARAYRAPTWNERWIQQRFLPEDLAPGLILLNYGNPDLGRERVDALEVGASARLGGGSVLKLDLYRNRMQDFIERQDPVFVPGTGGGPDELRMYWQNRAQPFHVDGGELVWEARPRENIDLRAGWAFRDVDLPEEDGSAAYAPRSRITLTVGYAPGPFTFDLSGSSASSYTVSAPGVFGLRPQPSYTMLDAAAAYHWNLGATRLHLKLSGRNLLDEEVYETLIAPSIDTRLRGRGYAVELRAEF